MSVKTSAAHLEAARQHLCLAMSAAESERQEAVTRHYGGTANLEADRCIRLLEIAVSTHGRLDRDLQNLHGH